MPQSEGGKPGDHMEDDNKPLLYHLVGVIIHKGEASHGHYYTVLKHVSLYVCVYACMRKCVHISCVTVYILCVFLCECDCIFGV